MNTCETYTQFYYYFNEQSIHSGFLSPQRILCYNADPCQHLLMLLANDLGYVVQVGDGLSEFCQRLCHIPSFCVIFVETVGHNCFDALPFPLHLKGFF